jgi:hypothetical protein
MEGNLVVDGLVIGGHGSLLEGLGERRVSVACSRNIWTVVSKYPMDGLKVDIPSELAPYSSARVPSAIISPALAPMMWIPNILSVSASARNFTTPSVSRLVFALELAEKGKFRPCT